MSTTSPADAQPSMAVLHKCYAATEFDPPDHQFTVWVLSIKPSGVVRSVRLKTEASNHPRLAPCVQLAHGLAATAKGGTPEIFLTARTRNNP